MWHPLQRVKVRIAGVCLLAAASLCHATSASAEAVGSPASILKKGKWTFGLGGSALPARDLNGGATATMYQFGHFRGYGLTDRLSIYGKIGVAYLEVEDSSIKKRSSSSATNRFDANVLSSVQLKGRLFESRNKSWEWDGSLQYVDIRKRHRGKNDGRWHEWQFATSVAKSFNRLKPYLGLKYNTVSFHFKVRENNELLQQGTYEEDQPIGLFLGTDFYFGRYEDVIVNVEGSSLNGTEVSVAVAYTF
ncbi:MAG: hypothetical protein HYY58_05655 [Candidatus Omnitrophica bacterium]|nr:hypothetical protein [Candidatus Omnitrophota bacterium]